jgi:hypothetical protein
MLSRAIGPFLAGVLGALSLAPFAAAMLREHLVRLGQPEPPLLPLIAIAQPLILIAIASLIGGAFARRLGLRSRVSEWPVQGAAAWSTTARELPIAAGAGVAIAIVVAGGDVVLRGAFSDLAALTPVLAPRTLDDLLVGVLYGGISEEVLMRWGLVTLLVWLPLRPRAGTVAAPSTTIMWVAIVAAALAFGAGHLPALAASGVTLTAAVVIRTVALNALGGVVFGWLYWRYSLEAAMVAHAMVHVTWAITAALVAS